MDVLVALMPALPVIHASTEVDPNWGCSRRSTAIVTKLAELYDKVTKPLRVCHLAVLAKKKIDHRARRLSGYASAMVWHRAGVVSVHTWHTTREASVVTACCVTVAICCAYKS